jgi:two-component system cell cycle sensor histidine kinase/response regulator CckA
MPQPLKVLIVEDSSADADLLVRSLRQAGFDPDWKRVDTESAFLEQLHDKQLDLVLSDYEMPQFNAPSALELLKQSGLEVPFIIVSGTIGEETAVAAMKQGAADYLLKDRLARLGSAVSHAVAESRLHRERKQADEALRKSEERFRELAENVREVFWITDPAKNQMLYISPAYEKIWGRTCQSLYESPRTWIEAIRPEDRERVLQASLTKQPLGTYDEQYRIIRPDGEERWIRDRAFPVFNDNGEIKRVFGFAEDITEHRKLEEQFRQAQKMEAIGTLAGGIAHDFNNILSAILGYTQLSQMVLVENPEVRKYLDAILTASTRAANLVRQILTFSRQQSHERRPIKLGPVVDECLQLLRSTIPSTIEFDVSFATDAPTVLADATQVHQIVMNIGTNAWHAMKDRSGRLQVKLERCAVDDAHAATQSQLRPGVYARVSISDTGCGMDQATRQRIFEPFFTTKPPSEGTGLGLAVVDGIMKDHDGAVTVYSQPGEGTIFHLYFPAYAGEAIVVAGEHEPVPRGHGERILFVDDEELLVQLGQKTLTSLGYEVEVTTQPLAALAMVRADPQRFALVLADQAMPGMAGFILAGELLKIRPGLPVILMTGYSPSLTSAQIEAAGIRQLVRKPLTIHLLGTAVHTALLAKAKITGRILLVDDDDSFRGMLCLTLAHFGHTVIEASNGKEALALFKEAKADLVILDIIMPEKEGLEVLIELQKKQVPPIKVIAITGGNRQRAEENLKMAKLLGAAKVLIKPFPNEVLLAAVNELLSTKRAVQATR